MASSSSTPAAILSSPLGLPISEKLSKNNLQLWKLQVLPAIRGAQLLGYLDGSEVAPDKEIAVIDENKKEGKAPNPEYARWVATDQQVLSYLLSSMTKEVMLQVGAAATTSAGLWAAVDEIFSSQTRARAVNTRIAMANLKKNNLSADEYVGKMKALADELAAAGKPLGEDELVSYVLTGLDADYTPIVASLTSRREPVTYNELLSQIQSFESRLDLVHGINGGSGSQSSVNSATRSGGGRGNSGPSGGGQRGRGRNSQGGRGRNQGGRGRGNGGGQRPRFNGRCQVCFKEGHSAQQCWHRFDPDYVPDERNVNAAMYSYGVDTNWYTDTGATDHVTSELDRLTIQEKYTGNDKIRTANGAGMNINHIGNAIVRTPHRDLHLNNVLHVPQAKKNLVSVHRLTKDNKAFLEFHPNFFLIKDQVTRKTLLEGRCREMAFILFPN